MVFHVAFDKFRYGKEGRYVGRSELSLPTWYGPCLET
jgi:hypothetical protein